MKQYAISVILLAGITACSNEKEPTPVMPEPAPEVVIAFAPFDNCTRDINLELSHRSFVVWTYKNLPDGNTQVVMPGYNVVFVNDRDHWQYDGTAYPTETLLNNPLQYLKFWDASAETYRFAAYVASGDIDITPDPAGGFRISGIQGHVTAGNECLVANHQRTLSPTPQDVDLLDPNAVYTQPTTYYSVVPLRFHNLLADVEFRIYNAGNKEAAIREVRVAVDNGLSTTADYTAEGWSNLGSSISNIVANDYSLNELKLGKKMKKEDAVPLSDTFEIPQTFPDGMRVVVDVNGYILNKKFTIDDVWIVDNKYVYFIRLDISDDTDPILVDITCSDFNSGGDEEFEEINW